jgi:hypothetical protein
VNESIFKALCRASGLPEPVPEYRFHPKRKWRLDWAFPCDDNGVAVKVGLEIDGGAFAGKPCAFCGQRKGGRHNRGAGFLKDICKLNEAQILGWKVLRCTPSDVESGAVFELLKRAMG